MADTKPAASGDTATVHYRGTLASGETFDSSFGGEPLVFKLGAGQLIPGFEQTVLGMRPGETRSVTLPAAEAYGAHRPELVLSVPLSELPAAPEVGQQLELEREGGERVGVTVTSVTPERATLDANHPLAGCDLTFDIELVALS